MPDAKIIDYLRQHKDKYPAEALKQALINNGFAPADVDEALRAVENEIAPPPPQPGTPPAGDTPSGAGRIRYAPGQLFSNAVAMVKDPEGFFSRLDPQAGLGGGVLNVLLWALVAALVSFALAMAGLGGSTPGAKLVATIGVVFVPIVAVVLSFVGSLVFHVLCKIMGGSAAYSASYNALAGIIALAPVSAILHSVHPLWGSLPVQLYGLYLSVHAASAVHAIPKKRAWIVFGLLTVLGLASQYFLNLANRRMQALTDPEKLQQTLGLPGQPGASVDPQQALQQAQQIMQGMERYGAMDAPPQETLSLLDEKGRARLAEVWPKLSAPVRQSLVQGLPQVPAGDRLQSIDQTVEATAGVNEMVNQGMQMLQQLQQQQRTGSQ